MAKFPRPGMGSIVSAVTGAAGVGFGMPSTGLSIPMIEIDPRFNFVRGTAIYAGQIDKLSMEFRSFKEPLKDSLHKVVIPSIHANFAAQGRPSWKALTKRTVQDRMYKGFARGPILQRTRRLKQMATRKNIWEIVPLSSRSGAGADMLKMRTNYFDQLVPYGKYHQLGAMVPQTRRSNRLRIEISKGLSGETDDFESSRIIDESRTELFPGGEFGVIPARPYIKLTNMEEIEIYGIFVAFMVEKVNKHWGPDSEGL